LFLCREKTGYIQSIYSDVKKHFRKEELIQMHIMSMEILTARCDYMNNHNIHNTITNNPENNRPKNRVPGSITVSDMSGVTVSLDMDSIWYMQQLLAIDQAYYPEMLYRFIIINSPWYFPALYNMFKPFIDSRTRDKVIILGADYLPTLEQYMNRSEIPVEYGGDSLESKWDALYHPSSGASMEQLNEYFSPERYRRYVLTSEEKAALRAGLIASNRQSELEAVDTMPEMTPPPPSPSPSQTAAADPAALSPTIGRPKERKSRAKHVWKPKEMFEVKSLRVADMLSTQIVSVEDRGTHDCYVIQVNCGENISWQVSSLLPPLLPPVTKLE
jgi:hypothetical protein